MYNFCVRVVFKYSLIEEAKTLYDFIFHYEKIRGLRSIVFPSLVTIIKTKIYQKKYIEDLENIWEMIRPKFSKALEDAGLDWDPGVVICFIHTFRCEGWFNLLKNKIHARITQSTRRNTAETIVHELLHIITYRDDLSYREREDLVDKYMDMSVFKEILLAVPEH